MTIVAVTKIKFNRMLENEFAAASNGELVFLTDSARLVIGPDPRQGNPFYIRAADKENRFPFEAIEVLTETSSRTNELYGMAVRNQDRETTFAPVTILANETTPLRFAVKEGGFEQVMRLSGAVSATFEFFATVGGVASQSGLLRVLGGSTPVLSSDNQGGSPDLTFALGTDAGDTIIMVTNTTGDDAVLFVRAVFVTPVS